MFINQLKKKQTNWEAHTPFPSCPINCYGIANSIITIMISVQYRQVAKHVLTSEKRYLFLVLIGEMPYLHSPRQHKTALLALLMYSTGEPYNHSYIFLIVCQMSGELKLRVLFKTQNPWIVMANTMYGNNHKEKSWGQLYKSLVNFNYS